MTDLVELADRLAVQELYAKYCFAMDTSDVELIRDCFTEDGIFDVVGTAQWAGRDTIGEFIADSSANRPRHHFLNFWTKELSADRALSVAYFIVMSPQTGKTIGYGRYEDLSAKEADGGWRFSHRKIHFEWRAPEYGKRIEEVEQLSDND